MAGWADASRWLSFHVGSAPPPGGPVRHCGGTAKRRASPGGPPTSWSSRRKWRCSMLAGSVRKEMHTKAPAVCSRLRACTATTSIANLSAEGAEAGHAAVDGGVSAAGGGAVAVVCLWRGDLHWDSRGI
jgi:hypothetical protein